MFAWLAKSALMTSPVGGFLKVIPAWAWKALAVIAAVVGLFLLHQHAAHKAIRAAKHEQFLADKAALDQTVANYRAAAEQAKREDAANVARVQAEQQKINQESSDAYETRITAARARADKLRQQLASEANSGGRSTAPVSGVPASPGGSAQSPDANGLSIDERLLATEQAIQLDELIKWVKKQAGVDVNGKPK